MQTSVGGMMTPYLTQENKKNITSQNLGRNPITQLSLKSPACTQPRSGQVPGGARINNLLIQEMRLESQESKGSLSQKNIERQMLQKYAVAWNELAIGYCALKLWTDAAEAFKNAVQLYTKLSMRVHMAFAVGDYYFCLLMGG